MREYCVETPSAGPAQARGLTNMRGIGQKRVEMGIPLRGVERVCYAGARNDQGTKGERKVANSLNERARMAWRGWRW